MIASSLFAIVAFVCVSRPTVVFAPKAGAAAHEDTRQMPDKVLISKDYCIMEEFNATCRSPNEVLVVDRARYGRMRAGRCVTGGYGYLGCVVDVHRVLDHKCSGRPSCRFPIPDPDLHRTRACPGDFTSYLEASYYCLPVEAGDQTMCQQDRAIKLTGLTGFIASISMEQGGYGSSSCPWVIQTHRGQRVNITIHNFISSPNSESMHVGVDKPASGVHTGTAVNGGVNVQRVDVCFEVAAIWDGSDRKMVTVCGGDPRETVVLLSKTNRIRIEMASDRILASLGTFLLEYRVFSCPTVVRHGGDFWYQREGETLKVGCNYSTEVWYLVCKDRRWYGSVGNCSATSSPDAGWKLQHILTTDDTLPFGVLIVVAMGVAIGVVIGGVLLCLIAILTKRNRREEKEAADQQLTDERHRFFRQLSTHVTDNSSIGQTSAPPQCTVDWLHALTTPPPSVLEQSSNEIRALHPTPDYIARLPDDDYPLTVKSATVMPPCMGDCNPCNLVDGGGCGGGQGDHGFSIAVSTRALTSFRPCQLRTHTYEYPCMSQIQAL